MKKAGLISLALVFSPLLSFAQTDQNWPISVQYSEADVTDVITEAPNLYDWNNQLTLTVTIQEIENYKIYRPTSSPLKKGAVLTVVVGLDGI